MERELLQRIADLCYQAGEEIVDNEETKEILIACDKLQVLIDDYLEK